MTIYNALSIFFASVALLGSKADPLRYTLTPQTIIPGQSAKLRIELELSESQLGVIAQNPRYLRIEDKLLTENKNWIIQQNDFEIEGRTAAWTYSLNSYFPQVVRIPPLEISAGPQSYSTESMSLEIRTDVAEEDYNLRPGFGALELPARLPKWAKTLLWIFVFAAILLPLAYWLVRRYWPEKRQEVVLPPAPTPIDPEAWLSEQLEKLAPKVKNTSGDPRIIDETVSVLKKYFSLKHHSPVQAFTTEEFTRNFQLNEKGSPFVPFFKHCDVFRYAPNSKESPSEIASNGIRLAREVLLCT